MTNRIRLVIKAENGPGEPEDAFEPEVEVDAQGAVPGAPGGDSERPAGGSDATATAATAPLAPAASGAYPPCMPGRHTSTCMRVTGPCIYKPKTVTAVSDDVKCAWCQARKSHYYLTVRTHDGKTLRYCTKYCHQRNSAYTQELASKPVQEPQQPATQPATPSDSALDRWPVAQVQLVCASCWEEPCVCMSWPTGGVPL